MLTGIVDDIRAQVGRDVDFYIPTLSGCSLCTLDPVTNTSTDSLCSGCGGDYWIKTYTITTVTGHITWADADILNWQTGGVLFDGDCRVQIKLKDDTLNMLDNTDYVIIDDRTLEINSRILRGVPELNRVLVDCIEREK